MKSKANFNRVLIALDGGPLDEVMLRYSAYFFKFNEVERVFLMHVSKNLTLPQEIQEKYGDILAPKEDNLEKYLLELYKAHFGEKAPEAQVVLAEGHPFDEILRQTHIKDIDLLVLGRHKLERDHHLLGSRLAEQGPCSVLLVPEDSVSEINEILLPIDFSKRGLYSMDFAFNLSERLQADLRCLHLFPSAPMYLKNASSVREINQALETKSLADWQEYKQKNRLPKELKCDFQESQGDGPERCIFHADYIGADLIVISSKGRTASASMLLGSFSKELIRLNKKVPMLVLKTKHENLDFLKALQSLLN